MPDQPRCLDCRRVITDSAAIRRGYGAHCWRTRHPHPTRRATPPIRTRTTTPIDGQQQLDLEQESR